MKELANIISSFPLGKVLVAAFKSSRANPNQVCSRGGDVTKDLGQADLASDL